MYIFEICYVELFIFEKIGDQEIMYDLWLWFNVKFVNMPQGNFAIFVCCNN